MDTLQLSQSGIAHRVDPRTLVDDPHVALAVHRRDNPVLELGEGHYMVLRAADVMTVLTDPRTRQIDGASYVALGKVPAGHVANILQDTFVLDDGDSHRAKRGLFARAFAHGAMRKTRGQIRVAAERVVANLPTGGRFDFVDQMAARVPAEMIAEILGLPVGEVSWLAPRIYTLARAVTPNYPLDEHETIEAAARELVDYVERHLRARLAAPNEDLLSSVVHSWNAGRPISFMSLVHQVITLLVGGADTTRANFAALVALLLRNREQWRAVVADPNLAPGAVAEALRFDPAVGCITRLTLEPLRLSGVEIPAGATVRASTMSAMRDPDLFREPDRFDIHRDDHPRLHLAFGDGPHRCIGEMLARIEMEEGLTALTAAAPEIRLETAPTMTGFGGLRRISPMWVHIP